MPRDIALLYRGPVRFMDEDDGLGFFGEGIFGMLFLNYL